MFRISLLKKVYIYLQIIFSRTRFAEDFAQLVKINGTNVVGQIQCNRPGDKKKKKNEPYSKVLLTYADVSSI